MIRSWVRPGVLFIASAALWCLLSASSKAEDVTPVPETIHVCIPNLFANICSDWKLRDEQNHFEYLADWDNGAKSTIKIIRLDNAAIILQEYSDRTDDPATYFGKLAGNNIENGLYFRTSNAVIEVGGWTGKLASPMNITERSRPVTECLADCTKEDNWENERNEPMLSKMEGNCQAFQAGNDYTNGQDDCFTLRDTVQIFTRKANLCRASCSK